MNLEAGGLVVTPLGIGGYFPNEERETSCVLVQHGTTALMFDSGTGCQRLADPAIRSRLADTRILHLLLSHLHHDHICGLTWLLKLWDRELLVYVPTAPILACDGIAAIRAMVNPPYFSLPIDEWPSKPHLVPIEAGELVIDDLQIRILPQQHAGGSAGYRVGPFSYITDTEPDDRHIAFLRDASLVFMDTMYDETDRQALVSQPDRAVDHGSPQVNSRIARAAGIGKLGLVHLDPTYDSQRIERLCAEARAGFGEAFVPVEMRSYPA